MTTTEHETDDRWEMHNYQHDIYYPFRQKSGIKTVYKIWIAARRKNSTFTWVGWTKKRVREKAKKWIKSNQQAPIIEGFNLAIKEHATIFVSSCCPPISRPLFLHRDKELDYNFIPQVKFVIAQILLCLSAILTRKMVETCIYRPVKLYLILD